MANFYTELCLKLTWPPEALCHVHDLAKAVDMLDMGEDTEDVPEFLLAEAREIFERYGCSHGCFFDFAPGEWRQLIISHEESACVDAVADILQSAMRRFDIVDPVPLEWASVSSNALPGGFGGGTLVVSRDRIVCLPRGMDSSRIAAALKAGLPTPEEMAVELYTGLKDIIGAADNGQPYGREELARLFIPLLDKARAVGICGPGEEPPSPGEFEDVAGPGN